MVYHKLCDDINDSSFFKALIKRILRPFFSLKRNKAKKKFPQVDEIITSAMLEQSEVEKKKDAGIDASAHPSAFAMGKLLSYGFEGETASKLERLGYLAGRWVYLTDAFDDMYDDKKTSSYNVFNNIDKNEKEAEEYAEGVLNVTAAQLMREFDALEPARFGNILENIVVDGMYNTVQTIKKERQNEKSV
jgi:hypothetical protein